MSNRDWYFVGGFLAVVVVIVVLFNNESKNDVATSASVSPSPTATWTPQPAPSGTPYAQSELHEAEVKAAKGTQSAFTTGLCAQ